MTFTPPPPNCSLCPRLVAFRGANAAQYPQFFNGAVPSFGDLSAQMLVVGLAPGLKGANATGRPFTGDYAGLVLYAGLATHGFTAGEYDPSKFAAGRMAASPDASAKGDGFTLRNVRITNAVRCVPPENKPTPLEEKNCHPFLVREMAAMPNLRIILSLGLTSHNAVLRTLGLKLSQYKFAHGAVHEIVVSRQLPVVSKEMEIAKYGSPFTTHHSLMLLDSYHTSRYNISTGRLTQAMFNEVVAQVRGLLGQGT